MSIKQSGLNTPVDSLATKLVTNQNVIADTISRISDLLMTTNDSVVCNRLKFIATSMINESSFMDTTKEVYLNLIETADTISKLCGARVN